MNLRLLPFVFRGVLLAAFTLMTAAGIVRAQPTTPELLPMTGSEIFRALLKHQGLDPILPFSQTQNDVALRDCVVVILGRLPAEQEPRAYRNLRYLSRRTLESGGAVLFATDRTSDLTPYLANVPETTQIDGRTVSVGDPTQAYRGEPDLPFVHFAATPPLPDVDLAAMCRLKRVVTNRPSFINAGQPFVTLGRFQQPVQIKGQLSRGSLPVMAVSTNETMHAVLLADAGVLSNQMLAGESGTAENTDNFEFAMHLASYLARGPRGLELERKRKYVILWETDRYRDDFDRVSFSTELPAVQPSWEMIQAALAKNIDEKADELQRNDWPTHHLMKWLTPPPSLPGRLAGRPAWQQIMLRVAPFIAIVAILLGICRFRSSRRDGEPTVAKPLPEDDRYEDDTLFDERSRALLNLKNLREPLAESLRSYFEAWHAGTRILPPVSVKGASDYRSHITMELQSLATAMNFPPSRVTQMQWRQWHERADILQADHAAGLWWFNIEKGNA